MFKYIDEIQKECSSREDCRSCPQFSACGDITNIISNVCYGMNIPGVPSHWSNEEKDTIAIVLSLMLNEEK